LQSNTAAVCNFYFYCDKFAYIAILQYVLGMNKKILLLFLLVMTGAAMIVAIFMLLPSRKETSSSTLRITASAGFWGDIAGQIGGENVTVTSILDDPEADPHLYESGARDASDITKADVVITNGLGYDDFVDKILSTAPNDKRVFIKISDVLKKEANANPHIWYDIPSVPLVAAEIEARLSQKDPAHSATYKANLTTFIDALQPLLDRIGSIRAAHSGAAVAYTERVPEYMLQAAGLRIVSPESFASAIEEGNEPGPADQAAMRALIINKQVRVLLYNAQAESPVTQSLRELAAQNGVPVVAVTETAPTGKNFQAWQLSQLDALLAALNNSR
jgi:zinc/manganese transport system substrate-binding protein